MPLWLVIMALGATLLPIWRNAPAKEHLNFWQFVREEPFRSQGIERPHIKSTEAIARAKQAGYIH